MQHPRKGGHESDQDDRSQNDAHADASILPPVFQFLPPSLRRLLFTGSCCAGVVMLYLLSAWDHGILPGFDSSFARAGEVKNIKEDLGDLYVLSLGRAIRDLSADNCAAHSVAITEQIDILQAKFRTRTGATYPHTECKKVS